MTMDVKRPRRSISQKLGVSFWLLLLIFSSQLVWDAARFAAPVLLLALLPLAVFVPSIARDNLRAIVWLCFVLLFYFISAVQLVFAGPDDPIAIWGLTAVVLLFVVAAMYIRMRGPEQRGAIAIQISDHEE